MEIEQLQMSDLNTLAKNVLLSECTQFWRLHFLQLVALFPPAVSTHTEGEDKIQVLLMVEGGRYVSLWKKKKKKKRCANWQRICNTIT